MNKVRAGCALRVPTVLLGIQIRAQFKTYAKCDDRSVQGSTGTYGVVLIPGWDGGWVIDGKI